MHNYIYESLTRLMSVRKQYRVCRTVQGIFRFTFTHNRWIRPRHTACVVSGTLLIHERTQTSLCSTSTTTDICPSLVQNQVVSNRIKPPRVCAVGVLSPNPRLSHLLNSFNPSLPPLEFGLFKSHPRKFPPLCIT